MFVVTYSTQNSTTVTLFTTIEDASQYFATLLNNRANDLVVSGIKPYSDMSIPEIKELISISDEFSDDTGVKCRLLVVELGTSFTI